VKGMEEAEKEGRRGEGRVASCTILGPFRSPRRETFNIKIKY